MRFLATSTSVRSSIGESQDVYLVEIGFSRSSAGSSIGCLIDEYPPYRASISRIMLRSETAMTLRVRRDHQCDRAYVAMPIRTAPGDPMAILPVPLSFSRVLPHAVQPDDILPCYRTVRSQH